MNALITGITGQDGSYLAEFLLKKGYEVYGIIRRTSTPNVHNLDNIITRINICEADLLDQSSLMNAISTCKPNEIYNLAGMSFVPSSWTQPILTAEFTALGVTRMLEAVRIVAPGARFYQASSSEMFGKVQQIPQTENTPFHPRSPYGVAKQFGHSITVNYRESFGMHASSGICFNHESPRRGPEFVTRKISSHVAAIKHGIRKELVLGNLDAKRDWGFAGDYVEAMWLMLQQDKPDDYVISTGEEHTVKEFLQVAFERVDLDYKKFVRIDPSLHRPAEVDLLVGDSAKARKVLNWKPKMYFKDLVHHMVDSDMKLMGGIVR